MADIGWVGEKRCRLRKDQSQYPRASIARNKTQPQDPGSETEPGALLVHLVPSVDNMNGKVSGRESLNGEAEPEHDLLEMGVFDGTKSVRAKHPCNVGRLKPADRTFTHFLELFGPLLF